MGDTTGITWCDATFNTWIASGLTGSQLCSGDGATSVKTRSREDGHEGSLHRGTRTRGSDSPKAKHQGRATGTELRSRVGKKAAGRLLDGREWNEFPESK